MMKILGADIAVRSVSDAQALPEKSILVPSVRFERIDVLRGVAILAVVGYHALGEVFGFVALPWIDGGGHAYSKVPHAAYWFVYPFTRGGAGVLLFFVISGFCIHWSFLKLELSKRIPLADWIRGFYARRFWRIYPPYLLALVLWSAFLVDWRTLKGLKMIGVHALLLHNFNEGHFFAIQGAWWSIAVEWQLYLVYPLFLMMRRLLGASAAMVSGIGIGAGWGAVNGWLFSPGSEAAFAFSQLPFGYWSQWLTGAWVAERIRTGRPLIPFSKILLAVALLVFAIGGEYASWQGVAYWAAIVSCALVLDLAVRVQRPEAGWEQFLGWVGLCSYSLYLNHGVIYIWMHHIIKPWAGDSPWLQLTVGLGSGSLLALILSMALYRWVELPAIAMEHHRAPSS